MPQAMKETVCCSQEREVLEEASVLEASEGEEEVKWKDPLYHMEQGVEVWEESEAK